MIKLRVLEILINNHVIRDKGNRLFDVNVNLYPDIVFFLD